MLLCLSVMAAAAADIPRPEYPQPQFQRDTWLNLNGPWEFDFDDANAGIDQNWASGAKKFSRTIVVPFAFESQKSGIHDTSFHPYVWYRRALTVPADWQRKRVLLHFGAVDYQAQVWINGRRAGEHEGGHVPFCFDITPLLQPGQNWLTVRAEDQPTDRSMPRGKQYWEPKPRRAFYTRTTGIWQTVWMEATGDCYLESVHIITSNDGVVQFEAGVARPQAGLQFQATVLSDGQTAAVSTVPAENAAALAAARVREPRLWSVDRPNLYDVVLELKRGSEVLDRVRSYFGFRTVGLEDGRVAINGRPVYLKMMLDQGYWPESTLTPPTDDAIQYDIKMMKEWGFNGARKHQKVEDPRYLYWADRMGFLVSSEMPNAQAFDDVYLGRFTREWLQAVARDYNHPSIILWAPINEGWGVPYLRDPRQQAHLKSLYWLTRALDPTRLFIDNEGGQHTEQTDLFAIHDYVRDGDLLYEKYKDLGKPGAAIATFGPRRLAPGVRYNGAPIVLSEFGGIAFIPPGHEAPAEAWGYSGVEKTQQNALDRMRGLYTAIAKIPAFVGICYTQLTDVEQEVNGLMTYDRKPKFDAATLREINALLR
jgi:beta-galactosidase/beta-glucuronidase